MSPPPPACPGCSGPSPFLFRTSDRNHAVDDHAFDYYRCSACRTVFLEPVPADLGRYYPPGYQRIPGSVAELASWAEHERHKLDVLQAYTSPGRLCEIGPSNGAFAYLAQQAGYTVEAVEMDAACCDFLRGSLGIRTECCADPAAGLEVIGPCDAIAMWHVLEHLPDPWATLEATARNLRTGGALVLAAPNPEAFQFAILGRRWVHVDAPRHVRLIPMATLRSRLTACGLRLVHATTRDVAAAGWNQFGWEWSLGTMATQPRCRRMLAAAGRVLTWIARPVELREGRGSTYTMVFRKGPA